MRWCSAHGHDGAKFYDRSDSCEGTEIDFQTGANAISTAPAS